MRRRSSELRKKMNVSEQETEMVLQTYKAGKLSGRNLHARDTLSVLTKISTGVIFFFAFLYKTCFKVTLQKLLGCQVGKCAIISRQVPKELEAVCVVVLGYQPCKRYTPPLKIICGLSLLHNYFKFPQKVVCGTSQLIFY